MPWKGVGNWAKKNREEVKTGRVESVIEGCVALREREIGERYLVEAVLHWSDFDGQEQTDSGTDTTGPSVSQTADPGNTAGA